MEVILACGSEACFSALQHSFQQRTERRAPHRTKTASLNIIEHHLNDVLLCAAALHTQKGKPLGLRIYWAFASHRGIATVDYQH